MQEEEFTKSTQTRPASNQFSPANYEIGLAND